MLEVFDRVVDKNLLILRMYLTRERRLQKAMLGTKSKYGKNAILKGTNLIDDGTAAERSGKIGGQRL